MKGEDYEGKEKSKEVVISFAVAVDEEASNEEIASRLERAIEGLGENVKSVSDVQVRTVPRIAAAAPGTGGGGYESRLWEKVTCDIFGGRLQSPGDPVELQEEVNEISSSMRELNARVEKLAERAEQ
jgi:hypothetical protein